MSIHEGFETLATGNTLCRVALLHLPEEGLLSAF